ncbi:helix-turn-helix transcriptional regulator [Nocardioides coralli]|uniref:helix-turn-helix transcriptional regulator n=1 Tax=Nocardioides coralli TaxID=2872154 RepID=UPI001CA42E4A|nr:WYL domain-containing protein [Nocardioides coralli]QZY27671.1 WYL domain-containing protein [Nocardioides coralli]
MSAPVQGGAREQLGRLLTLVPYLHARGEARVDEAAAVLGVSPQQVVKDLKVLFMCGLPGGYPDDLIDVDLDALEGPEADGVIRVSNADYLARPLRLTAAEATAVMVALLAVRGGASDETRAIVDRVLGKLQAAAAGTAPVAVEPGGADDPDSLAGLRADLDRAVHEGRQVRLTYWVPARDEETERVVDPRAVVDVRGATYLDAWCHSAEDGRMFRLDRIHAAEVLDAPVTRQQEPRDLGRDLFDFGDQAERVTLRLAPGASWVVEYYQVGDVRRQPDGSLEVDLDVADRRWLQRLLLRLAPHARIVSPAAWQAELADTARETMRLYGADDVQ